MQPRTRKVTGLTLTSFVVATAIGCSGTQSSNPASGGAAAVGGNANGTGGNTAETGGVPVIVPELGGAASTGGASSASGGNAAGGSVATGGTTATGGSTSASPTGGAQATGGSSSTGGASSGTGGALSTGGAKPTGGNSASGGISNTGGSLATGGKSTTGGVSPTGGKSTGGALATGGSKPTGGTTSAGGSTSTGGPASSTELCARWTADTADTSETGFTGNVSTCTAGDMSATGRANALRLLNLYRWIAALPAVATSDQHNQDDQACALMMAANNTLNHTPPTTWTCYTSNGATAAGSSNIAGSGAVLAIAMYMVDPGNATTLGHRRWCLSNSLGPIGIGSTGANSYSCMWTIGGSGNAGKQWMAWPPPGYFPMQAARDNWNRTLDTTGWSLQSDSINLAGATVTVTLNGTTLPVTVTQLGANYGSRYAISFIPSGWTMAAGNTYHVSVTGISTAIEYDVQVVSC